MGTYMSFHTVRPFFRFVASEKVVSGLVVLRFEKVYFVHLGLIIALAPIRIAFFARMCLRCRSKPRPQLE